MMIIYNILYFFAFLLFCPVLILRGKWHRGFFQRFGFIAPEIKYRLIQKPNIWFHAVSVGEVLAIAGLVEAIRKAHPANQIVISTVTKTGYALAEKRFPKEILIIFAPLDLRWSVERFLRAIAPEIFILVETELWPQILSSLARRDIPVVMVNGRISDRSFYQYQKFAFFFCRLVSSFRAFCMQSPLDADRIIALGATSKNLLVVGSMKFDDMPAGHVITAQQLGMSDDALIWVAGSTHPGEEKVVLDAFKKLKVQFPSLVLILAPRHIERSSEVYDIAASYGFSLSRFSELNSRSSAAEIILVDEIGHLKSLYRLASVVFVGKSLIGFGGQNIIEPAFFAKPIIVGPHMQNFADIVDIFISARALTMIEHPADLENAVGRILLSPQLRHELGQRAKTVVEKHQGATVVTARIISEVLSTQRFSKPS